MRPRLSSIRATCLAAALAAAPVAAQQETPDPPPRAETETDPGPSLMEQGLRLFFEGFMDEFEPALRDLAELAEGVEPALRDFMTEMGPALRELLAEVDDWSVYHPPERLPNGDIILRRKTPEEIEEPPLEEPGPDGQIEL
ncbi:hypothetical protein [Roseivivax sp. CAU 1761]